MFPPILGGRRMLPWHPLLEWQRARSRRMENLTSSPPRVKNGECSEKVSPQASCFSPRVASFTWRLTVLESEHVNRAYVLTTCGQQNGNSHSPFSSSRATKGCHTFLHGKAILLAPLFPHPPFFREPFSILWEGVTTPLVNLQYPKHNNLQVMTNNLMFTSSVSDSTTVGLQLVWIEQDKWNGGH